MRFFRNRKRFGWIPDQPDSRDFCLSSYMQLRGHKAHLRVDLDHHVKPVLNQRSTASCFAHAIVGAVRSGFRHIDSDMLEGGSKIRTLLQPEVAVLDEPLAGQ